MVYLYFSSHRKPSVLKTGCSGLLDRGLYSGTVSIQKPYFPSYLWNLIFFPSPQQSWIFTSRTFFAFLVFSSFFLFFLICSFFFSPFSYFSPKCHLLISCGEMGVLLSCFGDKILAVTFYMVPTLVRQGRPVLLCDGSGSPGSCGPAAAIPARRRRRRPPKRRARRPWRRLSWMWWPNWRSLSSWTRRRTVRRRRRGETQVTFLPHYSLRPVADLTSPCSLRPPA